MGWDKPEKVQAELKDNFVALLEKARKGQISPSRFPTPPKSTDRTSTTSSSPSELSAISSQPLAPVALSSSSPVSTSPPPSACPPPSTPCGYQKEDAIADLVTMIHALPSDANAAHPLCERHMTSLGPYHRFPMKLAALLLLARMLGWNGPTQVGVPHDPDAKFKALREFVLKRK
jgi:hypothetical protein